MVDTNPVLASCRRCAGFGVFLQGRHRLCRAAIGGGRRQGIVFDIPE